ncbi:MAG: GNAT family N-acetyltransferase [Anaerolineaceae bacterium]|nr:GNAT family N-acetyltransferase [Anaerolineaceae bacterium]
MQHKVDIQQQDHPQDVDIAFVSQQFRAYNDHQSGIFPSKELHLFAYAPDKQIVGGLFGDISWGWLHVETLWVSESHRKSGIGTSLMDRAEAEAIVMDVQQAYLETTDFQALDFYKKRGYEVFAQLENQPPGHICYYMKKTNLKS